MSDFLNPPLPPGGIVDGTINYGMLNNPGSSANGIPPLPSLPSLPSIDGSNSVASTVTGALSNTVNPATTPSTPKATSDGFVAKIAYLMLGVVIIAGAIWTYRKS